MGPAPRNVIIDIDTGFGIVPIDCVNIGRDIAGIISPHPIINKYSIKSCLAKSWIHGRSKNMNGINSVRSFFVLCMVKDKAAQSLKQEFVPWHDEPFATYVKEQSKQLAKLMIKKMIDKNERRTMVLFWCEKVWRVHENNWESEKALDEAGGGGGVEEGNGCKIDSRLIQDSIFYVLQWTNVYITSRHDPFGGLWPKNDGENHEVYELENWVKTDRLEGVSIGIQFRL